MIDILLGHYKNKHNEVIFEIFKIFLRIFSEKSGITGNIFGRFYMIFASRPNFKDSRKGGKQKCFHADPMQHLLWKQILFPENKKYFS